MVQGLEVDVSSAGSLARSLQTLRDAVQDPAVMDVVQLLATKPMQASLHAQNGCADVYDMSCTALLHPSLVISLCCCTFAEVQVFADMQLLANPSNK